MKMTARINPTKAQGHKPTTSGQLYGSYHRMLLITLSFSALLFLTAYVDCHPDFRTGASYPFLFDLHHSHSHRHVRQVEGEEDPNVVEFRRNWTSAFFDLARRSRSGNITYKFSRGYHVADTGDFSPRTTPAPTTAAPKNESTVSPVVRSPKKRRETEELSRGTTFAYNPSAANTTDALEIQALNNMSWQEELMHNSTAYAILREQGRSAIQPTSEPESATPYYFAELQDKEELQKQERQRAAVSGQSLLHANKDHVETLINNVFTVTRDFVTSDSVRPSVVQYVVQKMESFGLITGTQTFDPIDYPDLFDGVIPNGSNIIGILPGTLWGTKEDRILLVGAHWDTYPMSNGMDDNGSGVAAVLEIARALSEASCRPYHTIIFVAFDLEEVGCLGSIYFIRDYLIPHVLTAHGGARLRGAFILDTIMNYNSSANSQVFPPEWKKLVPDLLKELEEEEFKGNFLSTFYRTGVDQELADTLSRHWKRNLPNFAKQPENEEVDTDLNEKLAENRLRALRLPDNLYPVNSRSVNRHQKYQFKKVAMNLSADLPELDVLSNWVDLLRSDHSRFWFHNLDYPFTLPAVLITDTGPYRGMMQECYHQPCDSAEANVELKFADVNFLTKTCQSLIDTLLELSQAHCAPESTGPLLNLPGDGTANQPSAAPALLGSLLTILQWLGIV